MKHAVKIVDFSQQLVTININNYINSNWLKTNKQNKTSENY